MILTAKDFNALRLVTNRFRYRNDGGFDDWNPDTCTDLTGRSVTLTFGGEE